DEPIAVPMGSPHESRLLAVVIQSCPKLRDMDGKIGLLDIRLRPETLIDGLFPDHLRPLLQQKAQQLHGLGREMDQRRTLRKFAPIGVEAELAKVESHSWEIAQRIIAQKPAGVGPTNCRKFDCE